MRHDDYSMVWKALADPVRRQILDHLRERPWTTGDLAQAIGSSRFVTMNHLTTLERAGLVTARKQGRTRCNQLNPVPLQLISERWLRPYEAQWASSLLRLKSLVEGGKAMAEQTAPVRSLDVELEITIAGRPEEVFDALTTGVASWWGAPYLQGEATDLILEPTIGGRLYEVWGDRGGALWGTVTSVNRGQALTLVGPIGLPEPTHGVATFSLEAKDDSTLLRLRHQAFGNIGEESQASYSAGWKDLLDIRLRAFVERGQRHGLDQGHAGFRTATPEVTP